MSQTENETNEQDSSATRVLRLVRPRTPQESYFWRGYVAIARLVAFAMALIAVAEYVAHYRGFEMKATVIAATGFLDYAVPVLLSLLGAVVGQHVKGKQEPS